MIAVDTSVLVPAFASWHEGHRAAVTVLGRMPRVPAPALVETYSVLTRLPPPNRAPVAVVASFLADRPTEPPLVLAIGGYRRLMEQAAAHGFAGGSIHDALIASIARDAGAILLTRDRRAAPVYDRIGAPYQFVF